MQRRKKLLAFSLLGVVAWSAQTREAKALDQTYLGYANSAHDFAVNFRYVVGYPSAGLDSYCHDIEDGFPCQGSQGVGDLYEWYNASQLYADSAMRTASGVAYEPWMDRNYRLLNRTFNSPSTGLWDTRSSCGGYFSSASVYTGEVTNPAGGVKLVDDNGLTLVAYLDAFASTGLSKYSASASAIANWLMQPCSGAWDAAGGFWWDATKKFHHPSHANALAEKGLISLYRVNPQSFYYNWAVSVRTWLENNRRDATAGLYYWHENLETACIANSAAQACCPEQEQCVSPACQSDKEYFCRRARNTYFSYDQAIAIQADVAFYRLNNPTANPYAPANFDSYLQHARTLAQNLVNLLWDSNLGCFRISTVTDGSYTEGHRCSGVFSGWVSDALLELWEIDRTGTASFGGISKNWKQWAFENMEGLRINTRNPATGAHSSSWPRIPVPPGSGIPGTTGPREVYQLVDQAWMQRIYAKYALAP